MERFRIWRQLHPVSSIPIHTSHECVSQTDKQTDRQIDRQTDRQTDTPGPMSRFLKAKAEHVFKRRFHYV